MSSPQQSQLYYSWSRFYDVLFGPVLIPGIHRTIRSLEIPPEARVLELGVGTGLSLKAYPRHAQIVGIDTSEQMLQRAEQMVQKHQWDHIVLQRMNAMNMEFPDGTFDYVMAFHILSVVDDCNRLLQEMVRVSRRNATFVIVNHLRSDERWCAKFLDWIDPLTRRLGWQTTLSSGNVLDESPLRVVRQFKTAPGSLFTVIIAKRAGESAAPPVPQYKKYAVSPLG